MHAGTIQRLPVTQEHHVIYFFTYVVKGLMPSNSARYTKSVELHYESGKMKTRRFLLLRVSC